jgi:hypothetical protein
VDSAFKAAERSSGLRRDLNDPLVVKPLFELLLRMGRIADKSFHKIRKLAKLVP